ncbi:MAG: DUF1987 domain-containing protein [Candidatus Cyclobacteriaceae bacterium M3_2C_046]
MEPLIIDATDTTPHVTFDNHKGIMEMKGASYDEDATDFFSQIIDWVQKYQQQPNATIVMNLHFKYLNSSSAYSLYELLKSFSVIKSKGTHLTINWFHGDEDEDIKEAGEEYSELLELPFNIKEI